MERYLERRALPESVATPNVYGMVNDLQTTQDHLTLPEKTSADWTRCKYSLLTEGE